MAQHEKYSDILIDLASIWYYMNKNILKYFSIFHVHIFFCIILNKVWLKNFFLCNYIW